MSKGQLSPKGVVEIRGFDATVLEARIKRHDIRVGILGLGYVGLPLSMALAANGVVVTGFDTDREKVYKLNEGKSYIRHIPAEKIAAAVSQRKFSATSDAHSLSDLDVLVICVPTPLSRNRDPDLTFVVSTAELVAPRLRRGQLVVLESTTYPGTTREVVKPILERSGLQSGIDFFLAYSPEREDPGNERYTTSTTPKLVGGDGDAALRLAAAFYAQVTPKVVTVSTPEAAEAAKLTENIFRAVNIALVNELKVIYEAMGIDVWEVIDAAKTKPFGFMAFYPGPGLGGHCIPIDPFYLTWKAREYGLAARFVELSGEINTAMPAHVVGRLTEAVNQRFAKGLKGTRILVVGLAYKRNVDDTRESPAFTLMELIEKQGAAVAYHDPYVPEIPPTREHGAYAGRRSVSFDRQTLAGFDCALVCTDHDSIDYRLLVESCPLVVDTRNACASRGVLSDKVVKA
jgi:UDP-N-acetyl-D-glucosamine dehydrogenase